MLIYTGTAKCRRCGMTGSYTFNGKIIDRHFS